MTQPEAQGPGCRQQMVVPPGARGLHMHLFDFDDTDLAANRSGHMTARQQRKLRRRLYGVALATGLPLVLLALIFGFLLWGALTVSGGSLFYVLGLVVVAGGMWLLLVGGRHHWRNIRGDLRDGVVQPITGPASVSQRAIRDPNGTRVQYVLEIGYQRFQVNRDVYEAFLVGGMYTVFLAPRTQSILSVEPKPHNDQMPALDQFLVFTM